MPKTRREFWEAKFATNITRDARNEAALVEAGWKVAVVWECETTDADHLSRLISKLLA